MDFSPITKLRVKNFRNIGDVTLSFEESPIVTLMGENEAGKTSIVKALAVAGANAYPARQTRFIRTGTSGFGIQVEFADGSYLIRQKGGPGIGNRLKVHLADGTDLQDDKIDKGEGIPVNMEKLMGFMLEPETGELLNVRTYEDALMFVTTPDSANYKILYNGLKVGQVTRAIKAGNKEVSTLRAEIDSNSVRMDGLQSTLKSIRLVDLTPLVGIKKRLEKELSNLKLLEEAIKTLRALQEAQDTLGYLAAIEENGVKQVDLMLAEVFERAVSDKKGLDNASVYDAMLSPADSLEKISQEAVVNLGQAMRYVGEYNSHFKMAQVYKEVGSINRVGTAILSQLASVKQELDLYDRALGMSQVYCGIAGAKIVDTSVDTLFVSSIESKKALDDQLEVEKQLQKDTQECVDTIHQAGGDVGVCSNCGHLVVVQKFPKSEVG